MGLCRRALCWSSVSVDLFHRKSDFAPSQLTVLEELASACIFAVSPSITMCCRTGFLPVPLSCPRTFAHLILSACHALLSPSELSRHRFTFWVSAQMSLCQGSLPGCTLNFPVAVSTVIITYLLVGLLTECPQTPSCLQAL